ncbi:adenosine deaminase [Microbacterium caowuchunii]|uniref:adenosine deaminase n=1 Tax=Microbacterium caowuchunii TaxID=2614638 RepID=UPI0012482AFE|nr:adenosine deaminase [Microbacterium caowuchunii]QEV98894.1 adenosine deaminase [Microbacterium caowuchunii]
MHHPTVLEHIDEDAIRALPKAEVHIHLEGTFSLLDILTLAKENQVALPGPAATLFDITTHDAFTAPAVTTGGGAGAGAAGLTGFLRFLDWQCGLVRTPAQAARVAYAFAVRQSASGIRYSDVIVNPTHWNAWRGREFDLLEAFATGFDEAEQDGLCEVRIAYSLLRSQSAEEAERIVRDILELRPRRVIALSVDGDEKVSGRTGEKFRTAFALAASGGLRRTVHAGESSGPEGVWDAVELLQAERIDHGVRSIEDPALLERLVADGISLGVCPRSNVSLGIYPSWPEHPVRRLLEAGVQVTLNTDDPAPLGSTLESDWSVAAQQFGFTYADLVGFAARSIDASFAEPETKSRLHAELAAVAEARGR